MARRNKSLGPRTAKDAAKHARHPKVQHATVMLGTADVKDINMQNYMSGADAAQKRQELGDKTTNDLQGYTKRAKEAEERREALRRLK